MEKLIILILLFSISSFNKNVGVIEDPKETILDQVIDTTGTEHWYKNIESGSVYCWKHQMLEELTILNIAVL